MTKFNVSRMPKAGSFRAGQLLASGPLCLLLACSVYEPPLAAAGGAGGGAGGTSAGTTTAGSSNDSGSAGTDAGGTKAGSGGASGGAAAGGNAGSAGSTTGGTSGGGSESAGTNAGGQPMGDATVIDDMEDADPQITVTAGRNGFWYVGNDLTVGGMQEPPSSKFEMFELTAGEHGDSLYSAHMKVSGWTGWGSVIGFNLVESQGVVTPYDAGAYCGVSFSGKAMAATALRLRLPDGDTHPDGGVCKQTGAANQLCYDHFSAPVTLTATWKPFTIMFSQLEQIGTGYHPADKKFKADQLFAMELALPGSAGKAYEIWIDDVALLACP